MRCRPLSVIGLLVLSVLGVGALSACQPEGLDPGTARLDLRVTDHATGRTWHVEADADEVVVLARENADDAVEHRATTPGEEWEPIVADLPALLRRHDGDGLPDCGGGVELAAWIADDEREELTELVACAGARRTGIEAIMSEIGPLTEAVGLGDPPGLEGPS